MKLTKSEKVWLGLAILFYVLYNIPFVPAYGDSVGCIIHGALTIIPLWIIIYVGYGKVTRLYRPKDDANEKKGSVKIEGGE